MTAACDWRSTVCFGSDRRLAEVSPAVLRHCVLALLPASLVLHSMPWRRFVSSVVPHPVDPHNVATEPPDADSTHGRSLSANCPHREGTHSILKLQADASAAIDWVLSC